jgi:hypothetical protein
MDDGSFSITLDNKAEFDISRLENAMLQTTYPALRSALSEHLEDASKKKAYEKLKLLGAGSVQKHATHYRVDGEIGRFTFRVWLFSATRNTSYAAILKSPLAACRPE